MSKPTFAILDKEMIDDIVSEAFHVLENIGIFVENDEAFRLLEAAGQKTEGQGTGRRVFFSRDLVEDAVKTAPSGIDLYDREGNHAVRMEEKNVCFDPGSAALTLLDGETGEIRPPVTADFVKYARLMRHMDNIHAQSTAIICADVPKVIQDRYRLYLGLLYCSKPIVTGTFSTESFEIMKQMLLAVRGGEDELREKPLAIFDACPSPPLKWSDLTCQAVIDAAKAGIPSELISMPMAGANSPVTLSGTLVIHTAETLSGVVISQLAREGAPVIYGGSPSIMDMRKGTTPMGAIGTMMIDSSYAQIGKSFGLPTHAYMGLSDSKMLDAQAGFESGIGAVLAALSGINMISGVGMLDFESCFSLEKLVIDNEICGMALRLMEGISKRGEPMAVDVINDYFRTGEVLSHPTTLKWYSKEQYIPSKVVDRNVTQAWIKEGGLSIRERARQRIGELLEKPDQGPNLDEAIGQKLRNIMETDSKNHGCSLPEHQ
jgi:trimethylamine--corrinoid protein Co-methyltransferase